MKKSRFLGSPHVYIVCVHSKLLMSEYFFVVYSHWLRMSSAWLENKEAA